MCDQVNSKTIKPCVWNSLTELYYFTDQWIFYLTQIITKDCVNDIVFHNPPSTTFFYYGSEAENTSGGICNVLIGCSGDKSIEAVKINHESNKLLVLIPNNNFSSECVIPILYYRIGYNYFTLLTPMNKTSKMKVSTNTFANSIQSIQCGKERCYGEVWRVEVAA